MSITVKPIEQSPSNHYNWLYNELTRFTYKPGWTFAILGGGYILDIRIRTIDTYDVTKWITVRSVSVVPNFIIGDSVAFATWLQDQIFRIERHESREWLRRDGQIYDNPHS